MSCPDCARLRQQNKAYAERRDAELADLVSQVHRHKVSIEQARKRMQHAEVEWTTDLPSKQPGGWWGYSSMNMKAEVIALVEEIERLRAEVDALSRPQH
jgi:hypothetical protein